MQENYLIQIKKDLQQITNMLILNGTLTECPGLVHGKIGIAIFFFHYAQYTNNMLFADYAMDLINGTLGQLHVNSQANYGKGIAGIGVGFNYMIQNNFLDIEDDICEDFDGRMYRAVKYDPWPDFSQYNGLTGYGRYWMTRLNYPIPTIQARECLTYIVKLIEENTLTVFISREEEAEELLWQIKHQGYTKSGMRKAGQYCVQLYENDIEKLQGAGMLRLISEDIEDFYELVDSGQYSEEMGLDLGIEFGMAVLM